VHGFRRFRCRDCGRQFNERTGTALNRVQVPTDIVFLVVFWRLRYKLSLRDLVGALACGSASKLGPRVGTVQAADFPRK
jgi:transposase-like protein